MRGLPTLNCNLERTDSAGFISVAVLWILGALSVLVSVYAVYVTNTASALAVYDDNLRAEAIVSAAVELTAYQQQATSIQLRPTSGSLSFRLGQANVAVEFRSEAARIDLNTAPKQMLVGLFLTLGARPDDVESYADRVIGWRTASSSNQDAEGSAYRMARVGYQPRGSNFPHSNELATVRDLPASLVERALPFVTVYSGLSQINIMDAAPEVVASLPGMTQERLNAFLVQRQASPQDAKSLLPAEAQQYATLEGSKSYRATIRTTFDSGQKDNAEVVLLLFDEGDQPFAILSWRDRSTEFIVDKRP